MNTKHGYGHIQDRADPRDLKTDDLIAAVHGQTQLYEVPAWGPAASSSNLTQFVKEMWQQGESEACVGFALARACDMRGFIQGFEDMEAPSPFAIWALARMFEKQLVEPLQNVGCQPRNACAMAQKWGLCPWSRWPSEMKNALIAPSPDMLSQASPYRTSSYFALEGADRAELVRESLTARVPVCVALQVDKTFNEFTGSHVMSEFDSSYLGGHYVTIIGHSEDAFLICNSWGTDWGFGGFAWISERRLLHPTTSNLRAVLVAPNIEEAA